MKDCSGFYGLVLVFLCIFVFGVMMSAAQTKCGAAQIFTASSCAGDATSPDENTLFQLVNKYRKANGRPELKVSPALSMLANRRLLDLEMNMKSLTHSWSNCPYDINDQKSWPCVLDAPTRLHSGYGGQGYETLYRTTAGRVVPVLAIEAWGKSPVHNSIILNLNVFKDLAYDEVGVAVDGQFAALWFGCQGSGAKAAAEGEMGLGVSFDQAVTGLSKILSINLASAQVEASSWRGASADKKIKLEIYGSQKDISEADIAVTMKLDAGKLTPQAQSALSTLLRNMFPELPDRDAWIESSVSAISANRTVSRTKLIRKAAIELRGDGPNALTLSVKPASQRGYIAVF